MYRIPFAVAVALVLTASTAGRGRADSIPNLSGVPATYTPGSSFTFDVTVPATLAQPPKSTTELGYAIYSFSVVLDITTTNVNPTITGSAAMPSSGYIFPGSTTFSSSTTGANTSSMQITFSDSSATPVPTANGNLILGQVTINPGDDGSITIAFDPTTTVGNTASQEYRNYVYPLGGPATVTEVPGISSVPAPAAWVSLAIGGLVLTARRRLLIRA